jgi:hypothetical protein
VVALGALACSLVASEARALPPIPDRWEHLDPRPANELTLESMTLGEFAGVAVGYRRGLGRHLSLGAHLEYAYPNPGYGQLVGFGHRVALTAWIKRPWTGVFFTASFALGHQFLVTLPELASVALGGGLDMGWSWDLPYQLNLAFSVGLRRMSVVEESTQICTLPDQCIFVSERFRPRFALSFGRRF